MSHDPTSSDDFGMSLASRVLPRTRTVRPTLSAARPGGLAARLVDFAAGLAVPALAQVEVEPSTLSDPAAQNVRPPIDSWLWGEAEHPEPEPEPRTPWRPQASSRRTVRRAPRRGLPLTTRRRQNTASGARTAPGAIARTLLPNTDPSAPIEASSVLRRTRTKDAAPERATPASRPTTAAARAAAPVASEQPEGLPSDLQRLQRMLIRDGLMQPRSPFESDGGPPSTVERAGDPAGRAPAPSPAARPATRPERAVPPADTAPRASSEGRIDRHVVSASRARRDAPAPIARIDEGATEVVNPRPSPFAIDATATPAPPTPSTLPGGDGGTNAARPDARAAAPARRGPAGPTAAPSASTREPIVRRNADLGRPPEAPSPRPATRPAPHAGAGPDAPAGVVSRAALDRILGTRPAPATPAATARRAPSPGTPTAAAGTTIPARAASAVVAASTPSGSALPAAPTSPSAAVAPAAPVRTDAPSIAPAGIAGVAEARVVVADERPSVETLPVAPTTAVALAERDEQSPAPDALRSPASTRPEIRRATEVAPAPTAPAPTAAPAVPAPSRQAAPSRPEVAERRATTRPATGPEPAHDAGRPAAFAAPTDRVDVGSLPVAAPFAAPAADASTARAADTVRRTHEPSAPATPPRQPGADAAPAGPGPADTDARAVARTVPPVDPRVRRTTPDGRDVTIRRLGEVTPRPTTATDELAVRPAVAERDGAAASPAMHRDDQPQRRAEPAAAPGSERMTAADVRRLRDVRDVRDTAPAAPSGAGETIRRTTVPGAPLPDLSVVRAAGAPDRDTVGAATLAPAAPGAPDPAVPGSVTRQTLQRALDRGEPVRRRPAPLPTVSAVVGAPAHRSSAIESVMHDRVAARSTAASGRAEPTRPIVAPVAATAPDADPAPQPIAERFMSELSRQRAPQPRALPQRFHEMSTLIAGTPQVRVANDVVSRQALRSVGKVAATVGDTIHLDRPIGQVRHDVLAHELTHVAHPSPAPRFFDDDRPSAEERRAEAVAKLMRSSAPSIVRRSPSTGGSPAPTSGDTVSAEALAAQLTGGGSANTIRREASWTKARPTGAPRGAQLGGARAASDDRVAQPPPEPAPVVAMPPTQRDEKFRIEDHFDRILEMLQDRVIAELERRGGRLRGGF